MTAVSPWAPSQGGTPQTPVPSPPPGPPQYGPPRSPTAVAPPRSRRLALLLLVAGAVVLIVAAIAATAAITYAIARNTNAPIAVPAPTPSPTAPQFSAAEQAAAKQHVCQVFDVSVRGQTGQGGVRQNGELNVPVVLRTLNSVVAVQNALTPAAPPDVAEAARTHVNTSLELTTAATGNVPIDEGIRLNDIANKAIFAFADVCGLPH